MTFTLEDTAANVLARLGIEASGGISTTLSARSDADIVREAIRAMLSAYGGMVTEASPEDVADGEIISPEVSFTEMPCGLYAAVMRLDADVIRVSAVKMKSWSRSAEGAVPASSPAGVRLWSGEPGIAGSPAGPTAYLAAGSAGLTLYAMGSPSRDDRLECLKVWKTLSVTPDGRFSFPARLYPLLLDRLTEEVRTFIGE